MKKTSNRIIYIVVSAIVAYGVVLPYLISAKHTELVLAGILIGGLNLIHQVKFIINTIKISQNEEK